MASWTLRTPMMEPAFAESQRRFRRDAGGHGGEYPDTMPLAIKLIDAEGRSCIYVPMQDGKVVDSQGYVLDQEDE